MSQVQFSTLQFEFAQCYTLVMNKNAKLNKLLNIFCIVYNKSIRSTIFNFNTLVCDLDIDANMLIHEIVRNPNILILQLVMLLLEI